MPKIKITEKDLTGVIQPSQISNTVFVPIQKASNDTAERAPFALVKSIDMLREYLGLEKTDTAYPRITDDAVESIEDLEGDAGTDEYTVTAVDVNGDMGYKLCKHLINIGLDVLVTVVDSLENVDWEALKDKGMYDIRFITLGAMTDDAGTGMSKAKSVAEKRGDCTALFNLPLAWSYALNDASSGSGGSTTPENPEGDDENGSGDNTFGSGDPSSPSPSDKPVIEYGSATFNLRETAADTPTTIVKKIQNFFKGAGASEYCACFAPNFYSTNSDLAVKTLDEISTTPIRNVYAISEAEVPAAFGYLFAYAAAIKNNPEWYAIAGFQRGFIPELSDVCYELSTTEMLSLQAREASSISDAYELDTENDNVGTAINPIANIRPAGYIIYGNRTFRYNDAAKKTTAASFLNVRNMVSGIKKKLWDASRKFTFEPNNEVLWVRFKSFITPYLDQLQSGNGIVGYKFERLATPAKARLKCRLVIIPVEAVEDFEIEVTLVDDLAIVE